MYKDKERDSKAFLDISGVKDKSKIVLVEDPISQEKRLLELRRNAKMEKASKSISEISLEIDRFAGRVSALESIINKGGKVAETDLVNLTELLMNQVLKLDGIMGDEDVKMQRKMQFCCKAAGEEVAHKTALTILQKLSNYDWEAKAVLAISAPQVRRVQKYVETLDMLKIKNANPASNGIDNPMQDQPSQHKSVSVHEQQTSETVVTTKWETFDFDFNSVLVSNSTSTSSATNNSVQPKFNWEFFE